MARHCLIFHGKDFVSRFEVVLFLFRDLYIHAVFKVWLRNVKQTVHNGTGSIRDDPYWISSKNSLELIELSSINKVSLV